ncbi:MAG: hypothetical protein JNJ41_18950 [Bacteroidia bacterium]|nr:hypothetical protein [Bacteroidia bacterium]
MKRILYKKNLLAILLFLIGFGCKTYKEKLSIQKINVSFAGGNNYKEKSNTGNLDLFIISDTSEHKVTTNDKFDLYSPSKKPVIIKLTKKNNSVILSDQNENEFALAITDSLEQTCNYNCKTYFDEADKVTFTSRLAFFPYWHGLSVLGGHPLFMRHHYYTLKIKKANGKRLKMQWTYSVQKFRPDDSNRKKWSGDYCVDNGGGLTQLRIK